MHGFMSCVLTSLFSRLKDTLMTYNNHADELARRGLSSPTICISPNNIYHNSLALMCFNNSTSSIKTEHNPRKLINVIQQATLFEQFLTLAQFSPILPIHDLSGINWDCTWFCLGNDVETPSCHTSFAHNSTFSWASKLLLDELPLLSKLQLR